MLRIYLFGKSRIQCKKQLLPAFEKQKVMELFVYLLLHRNQTHFRESLANLLWQQASAKQSKSYFRKTLWQLQTAINNIPITPSPPILSVNADWIEINTAPYIWLDIQLLESAFEHSKGIIGRNLSRQQARFLRRSVQFYQGDLMEGWFYDWCLFERERFQRIYLILLEKLLDYAIAHNDRDSGLIYGSQILKYDLAHERTHRQLMRLYYQFGNRTMSIRQYETCAEALEREFDIEPSERTESLLKLIKTGHYQVSQSEYAYGAFNANANGPLLGMIEDINNIQEQLSRLQEQLYEQLQVTSPDSVSERNRIRQKL